MAGPAAELSTDNAARHRANAEAVARIVSSQPVLTGVRPAGEVIAELGERDLLHAGPPLTGFDAVSGALSASILGALVHLGRARDLSEAEELARSGELRLLSANDHRAGGTYAGVIGRETPVLVVENRRFATMAVAALNEGRGKALRYGSNDREALDRLAWLEGEFAAMLDAAVRHCGGVDIYELLVQALHMGDDGHSRQKAASALFMNTIAPSLAEAGFGRLETARALDFMRRNDIFFLPLTMAAGKATMLAAQGIAGATVVTCMAANGREFGIKMSATGERWFTGPLPDVQGHYFEGFQAADANPVIGDSEIAETTGLGGFAMAAAPALARYVGGTPQEATRLSLEMYAICVGEHPRFTIPNLDFRGTPVGIDAARVAQTGTAPIFNTGIAHRMPGVGQIGAGFARAPLECFAGALAALAAEPAD